MIRDITEFEPRSLLLVLLAFTGNAQVMGLDLSLAVIAPLLVLTQLRQPLEIHRGSLLALLLCSAALCVAALRAPHVGVPYFDAYWLWPLKALLLMYLVAFGQELRWPLGNMVALALICLALIVVGRFEDGRLTSVFGPNMLYRIFGLLLIFSVLQLLQGTRVVKGKAAYAVLALCIGLGVFAVLLTGSIGGLVVIAAVCMLALIRLSKILAAVVIIPSVLWITTSGILNGSLTAGANAPPIFARFVYKTNTLEASDRLLGWGEILTRPLTAFGYNHSEFSNLWVFGYEYPHNIFIELYGFFGLLGILIILALVLALIVVVPAILRGDILVLTFVILTIGSMLSGDLSDNYGVIGLACAILARALAMRQSESSFDVGARPG